MWLLLLALAVVGALFVAVFHGLVQAEVEAWIERIARRTVRRHARKFPEPFAARFEEEWDETAERYGPLGKLQLALRLDKNRAINTMLEEVQDIQEEVDPSAGPTNHIIHVAPARLTIGGQLEPLRLEARIVSGVGTAAGTSTTRGVSAVSDTKIFPPSVTHGTLPVINSTTKLFAPSITRQND